MPQRRHRWLIPVTTLALIGLLWPQRTTARPVVALDGTRRVVGGVELVYQAPERPRGVFLVLHGCSHRATDAWPRSAGCDDCVGLPIETRVVGAALGRGWAVAAISSKDRHSGCWGRGDRERIAAATKWVRERTGAGPATVALGASSGGAAACYVPGVDASVAQIMASPLHMGSAHPPVRFVHMERDKRRAAMIHHQVAALRAAGVDAGEMVVHPEPLDAAALYRRGDGPGGEVLPTPETAEAVVAALRRSGFIDERGYLVEDPRRSNWRDTVREAVPAADTLVADASPVSEIMNVAFAQHEFTDAHLEESLDWLEGFAGPKRRGGGGELLQR